MWAGFVFAAYAAIANDSIQTIGTFIASNQDKKWWVLWLFLGGIFVSTITYSWMTVDVVGAINESGALVGDGAATLLATLLARAALCENNSLPAFQGGWKKRISIQPSVRERWTGDNELAILIQTSAEDWCNTSLNRTDVDGEPSLLLLEGTLEELPISIAVRNSGTEAKTSISIRFARGIHADGDQLMNDLVNILTPLLKP